MTVKLRVSRFPSVAELETELGHKPRSLIPKPGKTHSVLDRLGYFLGV